jgi:hypothetical protein
MGVILSIPLAKSEVDYSEGGCKWKVERGKGKVLRGRNAGKG